MDWHTRLLEVEEIPNKKKETIGEFVLRKWIAVIGGRMDCLQSNSGMECNNKMLTELEEYLGVRTTLTAAYSPHQNDVNERHHTIIDSMMRRMRLQDKNLLGQMALMWALVAKKSLLNVWGFSPFQLVYGIQPKLQSVYMAGPPALEEMSMDKLMANHINTMHLARLAYMAREADKSLKLDLKQHIYLRPEKVERGMWINF